MVDQGFFSSEKRRMAGEKENKPFFSVKVEPVQIANNINSYQNQTPSTKYPGDDYTDSLKESYKPKEEKPSYKDTPFTTSFGDTYTSDPYTRKDGFSVLDGGPNNAKLLRKSYEDKNFSQPHSIEGGKENFIKERNAYLSSIGKNIPESYAEKKVITGPFSAFKSMFSDDYQKGQINTRLKRFEEDSANYDYQAYRKDLRDKAFAESSLGDAEKNYYYKDFQKPGEFRTERQLDSYLKDRGAFMTNMPSNFEGGVSGLGKTTDDFSKDQRYQSTGGEEAKLNRLEKAKEEANPSVLQKVGNFLGDTFNALTGTQPAESSTLDSVVSSIDTDRAQQALSAASSFAGGNSQANYGSGRTGGFGIGTYGKGMPSNPGSQRQTGVGVSAGNLSRHKAGPSASKRGISKSTSRGQGGGTASRSKGGSFGGSRKSNTGSKQSSRGTAGSRGRGGTGTGSSRSGGTTGRSASSASKGNTGRGRSQCDIRTKIDVSPLINSNLVKDNLAEVAYFVQEIKK